MNCDFPLNREGTRIFPKHYYIVVIVQSYSFINSIHVFISAFDNLKNLSHAFKIHQISIFLLLCTYPNNIGKCLLP